MVVGDLGRPRAHMWTYLVAYVQRRFIGVQCGVGGGRLLRRVASILRRPLVKIWALPVNVGLPASWARCRDSRVVGRWSGRGGPKCSPLALLMVVAGVVFHLFLGR
jgi:hypothetical protein